MFDLPHTSQAELAVSVLGRLVPVWSDLGPAHAEGLRHALGRLALVYGATDARSPSPLVRSLHTEVAGSLGAAGNGAAAGVNRASLIARASRIASLRVAIARFLRDAVAASPITANTTTSTSPASPAPTGTPTANGMATSSSADAMQSSAAAGPMRCMGAGGRPEYDPQAGRPTLMLVRDMAEQAALDAAAALDELGELLELLKAPDRQLDDVTAAAKLAEYGPVGGAAAAEAAAFMADSVGGAGAGAMVGFAGGLPARRRLARHYVALAASALDGLLGKALFVLENALAIIVLHFLR